MQKTNLALVIFFLAILKAAVATEAQNTSSSYDPAELLSRIFSPNITLESRQRGYELIKFEDQAPNTNPGQYGLILPDRDQNSLRFEDDEYAPYYSYNGQNYNNLKFGDSPDQIHNGQVAFQNDNKLEGNKKRKRKRRRKPKNGLPGANVRPGFQEPVPGYGYPYDYPYGQPHRPPRRPRPRPSLASVALSSVLEALTSIATYDDYQCVPRLLCEAAGGRIGTNGVLQSVAAIQPLLTLLSAYNGISSSPLFVFGRAVFLGMTSKGNTGTCRYAYPQCPNDPEELIFYLNNYNGGFFRFFSAPQNLPPQNLEQFYNQLGQYQGQPGPYDMNPGQYQNPYPGPADYNQNNNYQTHNNNFDTNYNNPDTNYNRPSLYNNHQGNYAYNYNYGSNQIRFQDDNSIQKRIQNRPNHNLIEDSFEDDDGARAGWQFPDEGSQNYYNYQTTSSNYYNNIRDSKTMRFPDSTQTNYDQTDYRKGKVINFPDQNYHTNNYNSQTYNDRPHILTNSYETSTYSYNNGQNQNYYNNNNNNDYQTTPSNYYNNNQGIKYYNYNQTPSNDYQNNQNYNKRPNNYQYHNNDYNNNYNNAVQMYYNQRPANNNNYHSNQNYYSDHQNMYNNNQKYPQTTVFNNEEYVFDHKNNFYVKNQNNNNYKPNNNYNNQNNNNYKPNNNYNNQNNNNYNPNNNYNNQNNNNYNPNNNYNNQNNNNYNNNYYNPNNFKRAEPDDGLKTVYVVRGHGDPNKPEILKLKPGQSVH